MKGSMLKKSTRKNARQSPTKVMFQDPVGHELPLSLQQFRWNVDKVERKLQEKIQEKTKIAGNFVYQQAYRLLECTRGEGIDFQSFKEQLRIKFGIILEDAELQLLFDKYDEDRNGTIDLNEFIRRVLPPDYNYGRQWFEVSQQQSDERQAALKRESRHEFLMGMGVVRDDNINNTGKASNWTLEDLMKHIQMKVVQKTPSGDDQYRRAFKMLRCGRDQGIRMKELRNNLKTKFGIFISEKQMKDLFSQFDADGSGEIDLQEFLQWVEPPAYPRNSKVPNGIWTADLSDEEGEDDGEDRHDDKDKREERERDFEEEERNGVDHDHRGHDTYEASSRRVVTGMPPTGKQKKERPMSANPKKTAMLRQRREQQQPKMTSSTSQLLERQPLRSGGRSPQSVSKATQTRRMSMSLADIHARSHLDSAQYATGSKLHHHIDAELESVVSGSSTSSGMMRPRSAGSVASSRPSSATASVCSSVRGAAYMKRPSTPQYLRQKCLESRLAGAATMGNDHHTHQQHHHQQQSATAGSTLKKRASVGPTVHFESASASKNGKHVFKTPPPRRHTTDGSRVSPEDSSLEAPRVVRVHPKQHDVRPFSHEGKVLRRSKTSSAGCR